VAEQALKRKPLATDNAGKPPDRVCGASAGELPDGEIDPSQWGRQTSATLLRSAQAQERAAR
jgi:hypothetical protein